MISHLLLDDDRGEEERVLRIVDDRAVGVLLEAVVARVGGLPAIDVTRLVTRTNVSRAGLAGWAA